MSRTLVNRGFVTTLIVLALAAEAVLRVVPLASPPLVRIVYGTTLAMYMEVRDRLIEAAPGVRVLALGDSLALTQFHPDVFAQARQMEAGTVFNAAYLATSIDSQQALLRAVGVERLQQLQQVLLFINPRRLTEEGDGESKLFRIAIPDQGGPWRAIWQERQVSPLLDYSRLYGLSRYLVGAAWMQVGRPASWDSVEYLSPHGGIRFPQRGGAANSTGYPYPQLDHLSDRVIAELRTLIVEIRSRGVEVVMLPSLHHPGTAPFIDASAARRFDAAMQALARETGSAWIALPGGADHVAEEHYLDYGHLNQSGGEAYTKFLAGRLPR